ncbi:MAG: hypothetical protein AVDCRST_MAG15-3118 [uncultured Rubellimicrobium sp.]|uniref:Uncharacterized protein n=1 Tax=uncultured Rubellimicrobium sp. TaxID=543078 RepID=A0A6J4Q9V5_9RHOB|nr:MAG: hypothetical protein AVDCRST_MAG15-3118 [uncultured Rubellimicrobium sp.]
MLRVSPVKLNHGTRFRKPMHQRNAAPIRGPGDQRAAAGRIKGIGLHDQLLHGTFPIAARLV